MRLNEKSVRLSKFTAWTAEHIKGDEKGEAQIYLDRLFKGFGHQGWAEAGGTCEKRVKNNTGGTSFADLVWKPRVVIEMKKRGTDLSKHYSQAFTYWTYLVPNRPRYAVLCNFDEFWIYDFETQMDTPVEKVTLANLPHNYGPLNFLFPGTVAPVFGNHHEEVTREAADKLATCFNSMVERGVNRDLAQRFILQILMAFFAEDIDGTATAHLSRGLVEAHARDEAGWGDQAGHDRMWYAVRDIAFENPVTEDETQEMMKRMGIPVGAGADPAAGVAAALVAGGAAPVGLRLRPLSALVRERA